MPQKLKSRPPAVQPQSHLAAIVASSSDAIISKDLDGTVRSWNPAAEKIFGYAAEEMVGRSIRTLIPDHLQHEEDEFLARIRRGEKISSFETCRMRKDGTLIDIAVTISPIHDDLGDIVGISTIAQNISDRTKTSGEIESLRRQIQIVANHAPVMIAQLDSSHTYLFVNNLYAEFFGKDPAEIVGRHARDILGEKAYEAACHKMDVALSGDEARYEFEATDQAGYVRVLEVRYAPQTRRSKKVSSFIAAISDVTERRSIEDQLRASRELLANVMNSTAEGIYGVDKDGCCSFANQSCLEILGFSSRQEVLGKNMHQLVHHHYSDGTEFPVKDCPIYQSLMTSERVHVGDGVFWRKDGTPLPVEYWSYPLMRDGVVTGSVVTFYDVTDRKHAEEARELLMKEVNHRANNLLTIVQSIARQTARESTGEDFSGKLIDRLRSLSALQDLIISGDWKAVNLADLARSQISHFGGMVENRCRMEGPEIDLTPAAAQGIGMAFHELATNSIKHGALSVESGTVSVSWHIEETQNGDFFEIVWQERDGPIVEQPERQGFGSTVIKRMAAAAVNGTVDLEYRRTGLYWRLWAPTRNSVLSD